MIKKHLPALVAGLCAVALTACGARDVIPGAKSDDGGRIDLVMMLNRAGDCEQIGKIVLAHSSSFGGLPAPVRDDTETSVRCIAEFENEIGSKAFLELGVPKDGGGDLGTVFDWELGDFECARVGVGIVTYQCSADLTLDESAAGGHDRAAYVSWENGYVVPSDGSLTVDEVEGDLVAMVEAYVEYLTS